MSGEDKTTNKKTSKKHKPFYENNPEPLQIQIPREPLIIKRCSYKDLPTRSPKTHTRKSKINSKTPNRFKEITHNNSGQKSNNNSRQQTYKFFMFLNFVFERCYCRLCLIHYLLFNFLMHPTSRLLSGSCSSSLQYIYIYIYIYIYSCKYIKLFYFISFQTKSLIF